MKTIKFAFIGGTGFYDIRNTKIVDQISIETPFGPPSGLISLVELANQTVAFLPRHGLDHNISPSYLPARANIYALKTIGIERLVSISAVGSLSEEINPEDAVIPDQLIDRTYQRVNTFFDKSMVAHISFAKPFCNELSESLIEASENYMNVHRGGTMVVIEGPAFSTSAESRLYQKWGGNIIGMTALPEAKLAREAEIRYASVSMVTDYDCWHPDHENVDVQTVIKVLLDNAVKAKNMVKNIIENFEDHIDPKDPTNNCLDVAIITAPEKRTKKTIDKLKTVAGRVLNK